jgi:hypothetical protein
MPNQHATVKVYQKWRKKFKGKQTKTATKLLLTNFLKKMSGIPIYESDQETGYNMWSSEHNMNASISISNTLHNKCMSLLFLPERHHISILDGVVDICVLVKGWEVVFMHNSRRANALSFDHKTAIERNLPIVSVIAALDLLNVQSILLVIHEGT